MDMLVNLYDLAPDAALDQKMADEGVTIRRALPPELHTIASWIGPRFGQGWVSEATVAMMRQPVSLLVAVKDGEVLGFACYDATARGFFGPTGVDETMRGKGIGHALLLKTLLAMYDQGYGYGVIGGAGPTGFYKRAVGAVVIEGSEEGIYKGMLNAAHATGITYS
ncbi:GNAT family N-acetyltransferase [Agrobacterium sp. a22-2]|uniref:GNAT family N-acetyltransferase n=1 Tax=Agrobacterium sp. a22-2 TaxID=2283840 RepID=UPI0014455FC5|nr:GNAT family N-acetyltransferase [Agrobacterium sp. a22-2]NKN38731.1 GNAT family N-acetyltransferase [Agrobacterium sp. a22-2]